MKREHLPELDELLQGVLARAMRAVDAEAASILIADEITGNLHFRAAVGGAVWISLLSSVAAQTGLPTMDEAIALSQTTGRPILAMAGQKT